MATIKDVAREAGVSTATVSRVLNKSGYMSEEAVNKVNKAMETLSYHPNAVARSLVRGKHNSIGVMFPYLSIPFWAELESELEQVAERKGYSLMLAVAPNDAEAYIEKFESMRARMPDGILTCYIKETEDYICNSETPTVILGNTSYGPSVSSNDEQGGLLAAKHLIAKGCKNIVHISGELGSRSSANARTYAFMKECEKEHIAYKVYETKRSQYLKMDFESVISNVFYENEHFDGIFASNDILAAHCVATALSLGYRIPEDIRIVGYDDISLSRWIYPSLTTIHQDNTKLAEIAVETLLKELEGEEVPDKQVLPVRLIERKTT